jgi:hypothetical protein
MQILASPTALKALATASVRNRSTASERRAGQAQSLQKLAERVAGRWPLPTYNFLTNSSGLFKARCSILFPVEAGPHWSCCGTDVAHHISGPLHSWSGLHDLCFLQADFRRQAQRHRPPGSRAQGCRSSRIIRAISRPSQENRSGSPGARPLRRPACLQRRLERTLSAQPLHHAYRVTAAPATKRQIPPK